LSSRFFPSRVNSLQKFTKCIAFAIAPNGSSAPTLVSGASAGVQSVTRASAGVFDVTLTDQFKSLISGQATVQLASASSSSTSAHKTVGSSTAVFTVTAGADSPGVLGNNLTITVVQSVLASLKVGTTNSFTVTAGTSYVGNEGEAITITVSQGTTLAVTTNGTNINIALATSGSTPAAIESAFNAAIDPGMASITSTTGSSAITQTSGPTALAGSVGFGSTTYVYTDGQNMTVYLPVTVSTGAPLAVSGATVVSAINAQVASGYMVASAGGVGTIVAAAQANLTGGATSNSGAVAQLGAISGSSNSNLSGGTVVVRVVDPESGSAIDIAQAAGNQINVELLVKTE
jgi:hypothetical protein